MAKPAHAVFEIVTTRLDVKPEDCLFVDDSAVNVRAAVEVGLRGHHYESPAGLARFLDRHKSFGRMCG